MRFFGKLLVLTVIMAVVAGGWVVLASQPKASEKRANLVITDQKKIYQRLVATEPTFYFDDYGVARIYGSVKNASPDECAYVKLEIEVRSKDGKLLKTLNVKVNDIASGAIKSYDINGGTISESINIVGKITDTGFVKR